MLHSIASAMVTSSHSNSRAGPLLSTGGGQTIRRTYGLGAVIATCRLPQLTSGWNGRAECGARCVQLQTRLGNTLNLGCQGQV